MLNTIKKIISDEIEIAPSEIKDYHTIEELGIDSLAWTEIILELEKEFNITISLDDTFDINKFNFSDLCRLTKATIDA